MFVYAAMMAICFTLPILDRFSTILELIWTSFDLEYLCMECRRVCNSLSRAINELYSSNLFISEDQQYAFTNKIPMPRELKSI